jgi:hypothetical protein
MCRTMTIAFTSLVKALWAGVLIAGSVQGAEQPEMSFDEGEGRQYSRESRFELGVRIRHYFRSFIYSRNDAENTPLYRAERRSGGDAEQSVRYGVGYESRTGLAQAVGKTNSISPAAVGPGEMDSMSEGNASGGGNAEGAGPGR